jgi:AbrB family looped-hinge helix DNA binding protein
MQKVRFKEKVRLSSKGQLILPVEVRRMFGLGGGDDIIVEVTDGIELKPVVKLSALRGILKGSKIGLGSKQLYAMREEWDKEWEADLKKKTGSTA